MGRIALLLGGFLLLATPAQAGLMDLLESIESPLLESPELPPLPDEPGEGKNWVGTEIPSPICRSWCWPAMPIPSGWRALAPRARRWHGRSPADAARHHR